MKKDTVYFELLDMIKENEIECPICQLLKKRSNQEISAYLYESVTDPVMRNKIKKTNGFCSVHANMIKEFGNPLAHSYIYIDVLETFCNQLVNQNMADIKPYKEHSNCLFCDLASKNQKRYISAFIDCYSFEEFANEYSSSNSVLCTSHFVDILSMGYTDKKNKRVPKFGMKNSKTFKYIQNIEQDTSIKYKNLIENLSEVMRKHDYRFTHEEWSEQEKNSWIKVVDIVSSKTFN